MTRHQTILCRHVTKHKSVAGTSGGLDCAGWMAARLLLLPGLLTALAAALDLPCNTEEVECGDGRCVPRAWRCDGEPDCSDGADETACEQVATCEPEQFRCAAGDCIPVAWQCDGEKDCPEEPALDEWSALCGRHYLLHCLLTQSTMVNILSILRCHLLVGGCCSM